MGKSCSDFFPGSEGSAATCFFLQGSVAYFRFRGRSVLIIVWGLMFWREDGPRASGSFCSRWFFWIRHLGLGSWNISFGGSIYGFLGLL